MGNVYSDGYNADNATPPVNHKPNTGGGRVRYYYDTYLQGASDGTIGDVVVMKNMPKGARFIPGGMVYFGTGNTNETLAVGYTGTAAGLVAATAAATAGSAALAVPFSAAEGTLEMSADTAIIVTNATAAIKAAQRITVHIPYVID